MLFIVRWKNGGNFVGECWLTFWAKRTLSVIWGYSFGSPYSTFVKKFFISLFFFSQDHLIVHDTPSKMTRHQQFFYFALRTLYFLYFALRSKYDDNYLQICLFYDRFCLRQVGGVIYIRKSKDLNLLVSLLVVTLIRNEFQFWHCVANYFVLNLISKEQRWFEIALEGLVSPDPLRISWIILT